MTYFDLPQNFNHNAESLLRRVRPHVVPPHIFSTVETVIIAPSTSNAMVYVDTSILHVARCCEGRMGGRWKLVDAEEEEMVGRYSVTADGAELALIDYVSKLSCGVRVM